MDRKKILIIGAGGYLGAHLSLYLAQQHYQVTTFCHRHRTDYPEWDSAMHRIIYGDITEPKDREKLLAHEYDYAVYLISLNHFDSNQSPSLVCKTNVLPLWEIADSMKNKVKKFIYFSTQQVYGRTSNPVISENDIPEPVNNYGLTHLLCENILRTLDIESTTHYINVRLSNGYGAPVFADNNCWWLVINDLCRNAIKNQRISLQSNGSPQRDFIHVEDIARATDTLLRTESSDNVYNLSSGQSYTIGEIAVLVQKIYWELTHQDISICPPEGQSLITEPVSRIQVDNSKIKSLGFHPQIDIRKGILSIFNILLSNKNVVYSQAEKKK